MQWMRAELAVVNNIIKNMILGSGDIKSCVHTRELKQTLDFRRSSLRSFQQSYDRVCDIVVIVAHRY